MQIVYLVLNFLGLLLMASAGSSHVAPDCGDATLRSQIRAAVEQQLVLHGVPPPPEMFKLLDSLKAATSPQATAIGAQVRASMSGHVVEVCEANDPKLDAPMFITIFFGGAGLPQPSAYVLNFGLPGAIATIGDPPKS